MVVWKQREYFTAGQRIRHGVVLSGDAGELDIYTDYGKASKRAGELNKYGAGIPEVQWKVYRLTISEARAPRPAKRKR